MSHNTRKQPDLRQPVASAAITSAALLQTKLYIPQMRADFVSRSRLLGQLNTGLKSKLTLISAPAGFGKTSLLSNWQAINPTPLSWVSLDAQDNDPIHFWRYVAAALDTLEPGIMQDVVSALSSPQPPPIRVIFPLLLNNLATLNDHIVLVLDDYHVIETASIHQDLSFFLEHLPTNAHLFLLSRADPPLPLTRLRSRGEMLEIRADELRFTDDEAVTFLNQSFGLNLAREEISPLLERTEGWIASLHLAALSMQGRSDLPAFVAAFTGSHRFVLDYLSEEVLQRQPQDVQDFLLQTSILERLTGSLCDAVTGRDDGQRMLENLEHANLFLVPLDDERRWYRYHHLFADFLRARFAQLYPLDVLALRGRAATWLEQNGFIDAAIAQFLSAQAWAEAMHLIGAHVPIKTSQGEALTIVRWLSALPEEVLANNPRLVLLYTGPLTVMGRLTEAEAWLQIAESKIGDTLQGEYAAARAFLAGTRGDLDPALQWSERALALLPKDSGAFRVIAASSQARAYMSTGQGHAGLRAISETRAIAQQHGLHALTLRSQFYEGKTSAIMGRLREARALFEAVLQATPRSRDPLPLEDCMVRLGLGEVLYYQNELAAAEGQFREALTKGAQWLNLEDRVPGVVTFSRLLWAKGLSEEARTLLGQTRRLAEQIQQTLALSWLGAAQAWLELKEGNLEAAEHWAQTQHLRASDEIPFYREFVYKVLAQLWTQQGQYQDALAILETLRHAAETTERTLHLVEVLILESLAYFKQGDPTRAHTTLLQALHLAEPIGLIRTFTESGEDVSILLKRVLESQQRSNIPAAQKVPVRFLQTLLAAVPNTSGTTSSTSKSEQLSERELTVLRLIADGLSNKAIAKRLDLATSTVKWYVNELFGKLEVSSRTQVIAKAHALQLI
jgi:LuxR family transcriptional regulator, maltose regulon positive regulatory protein